MEGGRVKGRKEERREGLLWLTVWGDTAHHGAEAGEHKVVGHIAFTARMQREGKAGLLSPLAQHTKLSCLYSGWFLPPHLNVSGNVFTDTPRHVLPG